MKTNIVEKIKSEIEKLGSQEAVANKCGISGTALSLYLKGKYGADVKSLENSIVAGLGISNDSWQLAKTRDLQMLHRAFEIAKDRSVFLGISDKAGSGKTASITAYEQGRKDVYVVRCREWTGRMFVDEVIRVLGLDMPKGYVTMDVKITKICGFFKARRAQSCQVIIDEADKLRPSALRTLIPIYNECDGFLSVVITGTENLEKEIKRGVEYARKGYDEIDSRFGRRYVKVSGCNKADVKAICQANGVQDDEVMERIWKACPKVRKQIEQKDVEVVVDMRLLKNLILFS